MQNSDTMKIANSERTTKNFEFRATHGVSPVDINPLNSSAEEEGGTTVLEVRMTRAFRSLLTWQLWKRKWKQG
ncbi:hypothetical protein Tco_0650869 [Tanacetum coccineum]